MNTGAQLSEAPAHGMVQDAFRVILPSSGKTFWKHSHRNMETLVSIATLNPNRMTVKIHKIVVQV